MAESFPAVPGSVPRARAAIVKLAGELGASNEALEAIRLATSEALTNSVLHAYDASPGEVHVSAEPGPGTLLVTVADDGAGLRPRLDRHGMGIGLALIAEAAEELAIIKRPTGGTELRMRFVL